MLTKPDRVNDESDHLYPAILPGAGYVLFTITPPVQRMQTEGVKIGVLDRTTGQSKVLVRGGGMGTAQYVPPGYLVYATRGTSLSAVRFNPNSGTVIGDAVPVVDQVSGGQGLGSQFAVSETGTVVYLPVGAATFAVSRPRSVVWVERNGKEHPTSWPFRAYTYPRISPDGSRIAFDIRDQDSDILIGDVRRETLTRLTFDPSSDFYPVWTPDSRSILFESSRTSSGNIYRQAADGTGSVEQLTTRLAGSPYTYSISPDGNNLVFQQNAQETGVDLALLPLHPKPVSTPLIRSMFDETNAEISPDGRWIAYQSNESGKEEIYVRPFPDVDHGRWQVSTDGGTRPLWARNGRELFYLDQEDLLTGVTVQTEPVVVSKPVRLLKSHYFSGFGGIQGGTTVAGRTYDVSPDGNQFLMFKDKQDDESTPAGFVVIVNWSEELKRLVPTK